MLRFELRHAARLWLQAPGKTLLLMVALAVSAALAFTAAKIMGAALWHVPPGVAAGKPYFTVLRQDSEGRRVGFSRRQAERFAQAGLAGSISLYGIHEFAVQVAGADFGTQPIGLVSRDFFDRLGVRPWRGSGLAATDAANGSGRIVLSHAFWRAAGRPELGARVAVGKGRFVLGGEVVGILPPDFVGIGRGVPAVWVADDALAQLPPAAFSRRTGSTQADAPAEDARGRAEYAATLELFDVVGVRAQGMSRATVVERVGALSFSEPADEPAATSLVRRTRAVVLDGINLDPGLAERILAYSGAGLLASALLLWLALGLLLIFLAARMPLRAQEFAVRRAAGATGRDFLFQSCIESLPLLAGLTPMLGAALWAAHRLALELPFFDRYLPGRVAAPGLAELAGAVGVIAVLVGVLSAIPALRIGKLTAAARVFSESATQRLLRQVQTALLVAVATVVGTAALAMVVDMQRLLDVDWGGTADRVWIASADDMESWSRLPEGMAMLAALRSDRTDAAIGWGMPLSGKLPFPEDRLRLPGLEHEPIWAQWNSVSANYFEVLGIPLVAGRLFADTELSAVIVDAAFAAALGRQPHEIVGRELTGTMGGRRTIVGVVAGVRYEGARHPAKPTAYQPFQAVPLPIYRLAVAAPDRNTAVQSLEPILARLGASEVRLGYERIADAVARETSLERLLAAVAVLLAAVVLGMLGLMLFVDAVLAVAARRREFGIRLAVGATVGDLLKIDLRPLAVVVAGGLLAAGLVCIHYWPRLIEVLETVRPADRWLLAVSMPAVTALVLGSAVWPTLRMLQLPLVEWLRAERG